MFFHVDESGNTGNSLFDANQPRLSYGLLSSKLNVDLLGEKLHKRMLKKLDVDELHANDLGVGPLTSIVPELRQLDKKMGFEFGYYFIEKREFAVAMLFEAVFDAGLNRAVPWASYWTPMRFPLINVLNGLVDDQSLRKAWELCQIKKPHIEKYGDDIKVLLEGLDQRATAIADARMREIIRDAFAYGIQNPFELDFGIADRRIISPNNIGFQFVLHDIASLRRRKTPKRKARVTVDRQGEFNRIQEETRLTLASMAEGIARVSESEKQFLLSQPMLGHLDRESILHEGMPDDTLVVAEEAAPIGLQIVDVYLWILNRLRDRKPLSEELQEFAHQLTKKTAYDGIGFEIMRHRWESFEEQLPQMSEMTDEQLRFAHEHREEHRQRVKEMRIKR